MVNFNILRKCDKKIIEKISFKEINNLEIIDDNMDDKINIFSSESDDFEDKKQDIDINLNEIINQKK